MTPVIAIDGPAGSGKSSVAREVAGRLGLEILETGAMYRVVALAVIEAGAGAGAESDESDAGRAAAALVESLAMEVGGGRVMLDGRDVSDRVREADVAKVVSVVAAEPAVRADLVQRQRQWVAERGGAVVEGRDIGSVVFPDADVKVYLTASEAERARRRGDEAAANVARRDRLDSSRAASPLVVAPGAVVIDSTDRSIDDVADEIVGYLE